jgi:acyl-coenzyme A thioesterase PaaI-like protein
MSLYVQETDPQGTCFGCGPANPDGLHLKSRLAEGGDYLIAEFQPQDKFNAGLPNVMYGGIIACLMDCHSIWTAIAFCYLAEGRAVGAGEKIWYVTGELSVKYLKPTPLDQATQLRAWIEGEVGRKTRVVCELGVSDRVTAQGEALAVRVPLPQHGR